MKDNKARKRNAKNLLKLYDVYNIENKYLMKSKKSYEKAHDQLYFFHMFMFVIL